MLQVIKSKNRRRLRRKRNPLMKNVDVIKPGGDVRVTSTPAKKGNNGHHTVSVSHKKIERPMSSTPPSSPPSGPTKMVLASGNSPGNSPILGGMSSSSSPSLLTPHMTSLSLSSSSAYMSAISSIASPLVQRSLAAASAPSTVSPYASAVSSTPSHAHAHAHTYGNGNGKILGDMKKKSLSSPVTHRVTISSSTTSSTSISSTSSGSSLSSNSNNANNGHGRHARKGSSKISLDEFLNESNDDRRARMAQLAADEEEALSSSSDRDDDNHGSSLYRSGHNDDVHNESSYDHGLPPKQAPSLPDPAVSSLSLSSSVSSSVVSSRGSGNVPAAATMERSISNDQIMSSRDTDSKDTSISLSTNSNTTNNNSSNSSSSSANGSSNMPISPVIAATSVNAPLRLQRMEHLLRHCHQGSLVAFDLDDTIHQSKYHPSWLMTTPGVNAFQQCMKTNERYASLPLATKNTMIRRLQTSLQDKRLCESNIAWVVRELQEAGCRVFALTARYAEMAPATIRALRSLGIDFATNAPFPAGAIRDPETEALCDDGIIYTNATDKGNVLNRFLHYVALPFLAAESAAANGIIPSATSPPPLVLPAEIVFVDDRLSNCRSVLAGLPVANQLNVPIVCYHYIPAAAAATNVSLPYAVHDDERDEEEPAAITEIPSQDLPLLHLQINHFMQGGPVLTNDEARSLLAASSSSSSSSSLPSLASLPSLSGATATAPSTPLPVISSSSITCSASVVASSSSLSSSSGIAISSVRVK